MFNLEEALNEWRIGVASKGRLSSEVMEELESHLLDSFEGHAKAFSEEESYRRALESLGDYPSLHAEFEKIDPLISIENNMKNLIFGSTIAIVGICLGVFMMGASLWIYFHPAELVALLVIPIGITVSSFGMARFWNAIRCVLGKRDFSNGSISVLNRWISATYATGALAFLIGVALAFNYFGEEHFGVMLSASFSAPIYAIIISELFLRSTLVKLAEQAEVS